MRPLAAVSAVIVVGLLAPVLVVAAKPRPVDTDLLEFLGSVDGEGEGWGEFLGNANLDRAAPAPTPAPPVRKTPPAAAPAPLPPPPSLKGAVK
jgi:hypothetical protein